MQNDFVRRSVLFGLLVLIAVAVPSLFAVTSFNAYRTAAAAVTRSEQLRGEIRRLDEVLTMSARMAATTEEERWIERYNSNVGDLDTAIKEMLSLGAPDIERMVHATDAANLALVDMETRSFDLVHRRRGAEAYDLLTSPEYEAQKAIYADGMSQAMAAVNEGFARETAQGWSRLLLASLLSVVGVSICCATWILLMRGSFREQERLRDMAHAERDAATAANAAKSMFLANMSHELRTPLNAVIGYSEMLREGAEEAARSGDIADHDRVIAAARRLLRMIDDVLDFSKSDAGKIVLKPHEFDVRALVEATAATIEPAVIAGQNRLRLSIDNDVGRAVSDEFRLGQCLLNLLSNASKFTKEGEISLSAHRDGATLVFEVRDTGIGISSKNLGELFQPFVQADSVASQVHGGTGLGLAITRQLARLMGGDVFASSELGAGSVFTLCVPSTYREAAFAERALAA